MTVTYSLFVSKSHFAPFVKLLFWRKGSLFKLLWKELVIFLSAYFLISILYRFALSEDRRIDFEKFSLFCAKYEELIPLTFILGFYVTFVANRWWQQFQAITWTDKIAISMAAFIRGDDLQRGRLVRRTIMRYVNLAQLLTLRMVSTAAKKRFPTSDHLVEAGFMTTEELEAFELIDNAYAKQYVPCQWACNILIQAGKDGMIVNDNIVARLVEEINNVRSSLEKLIMFDWISVPIVYTQVVTLVVYCYFGALLIGRQYLNPAKQQKGDYDDYYFPLFTTLEFLFYIGWLKVAEVMINPFGEDDDDFEVNYVIDRNLQVGYLYVDQLYGTYPPLQQDLHWNERSIDIPHTAASLGLMDSGFDGSAASVVVTPKLSEIVVFEENTDRDQKLALKVLTAFRKMSRRGSNLEAVNEETGVDRKITEPSTTRKISHTRPVVKRGSISLRPVESTIVEESDEGSEKSATQENHRTNPEDMTDEERSQTLPAQQLAEGSINANETSSRNAAPPHLLVVPVKDERN